MEGVGGVLYKAEEETTPGLFQLFLVPIHKLPFCPPVAREAASFFLRNGLISSFLLGAAEQENTLFIKEMLLYFLCIVRLW